MSLPISLLMSPSCHAMLKSSLISRKEASEHQVIFLRSVCVECQYDVRCSALGPKLRLGDREKISLL